MKNLSDGAPEEPNSESSVRGKRPITLWIISIYLVASGAVGVVSVLQQPLPSGMGILIGGTSALVQFASGILIWFGINIGKHIYLIATPVILLVFVTYYGGVAGFSNGTVWIAIATYLVQYSVIAYFLIRSRVVVVWLDASGNAEGYTGSVRENSVLIVRIRRIIAFNLIGGPILFLLGGFAVYFGNLVIWHIISVFLMVAGAYSARSYLSPGKDRYINRPVALGINSAALLVNGAQLIANYKRIDSFAMHSRGDAGFLGVALPLIPVLILVATLYFLARYDHQQTQPG